MIIVNPTQPTTRPPVGSGLPIETGDIWQATVSGLRQRFDGSGWVNFTPQIIYSLAAPAAAGRQIGDIWVHNTSGLQATWDGAAWVMTPQPQAGAVPLGGATNEHLAKAATRPFDLKWVDPTSGVVFLHEQRTASALWTITHEMRSTWVTVTAIDNTRDPAVVMIPDIEYLNNQCKLHFAEAVSGFAVVHASRLTPNTVIQ